MAWFTMRNFMLNKLLLLLFSAITLIEWLAFLYCVLRVLLVCHWVNGLGVLRIQDHHGGEVRLYIYMYYIWLIIFNNTLGVRVVNILYLSRVPTTQYKYDSFR